MNDTIDRQAAIEAVRKVWCDNDDQNDFKQRYYEMGNNDAVEDAIGYIDALPSAGTPTNTPTDLISRQEAIDSWDKLSKRGRTEFDQVLMTLPSAEAVQGDAETATATDCISRADLPKELNGVVLDDCDKIVDEFLEEHECDELWNVVRALRDFYDWTMDAPPVTPIAKTQQADTLIIADALRSFALDCGRHVSDRERAGELREQVLAYGASMCQPVTPTVSEDCISREYMLKLQRELHGWMPNDKSHELWQKIKDAPSVTPTERIGEWKAEGDCGITRCGQCGWSIEEYIEWNYCPNCGAKMGGDTE